MQSPSSLARLGWLPLLALLLWVLAWYATQAATRHPDFDGALNLNVSRALLEGHGYGSFYETFRRFPIETQTNGPLVLPAALSIAIFGLTPFGMQAVNLGYLLAFCALGFVLLRRLGASRALAAGGVLLASQAPGMRDFALHGYGEIPALCFMLVALLALARQLERAHWRWSLLAGVALGTSFLTKTVSLIWFPPLIGVFLLLRWRRDGWRLALRDAIAGGAGIALALAAWELYRMLSLGGLGGWIDWWRTQYAEVQKQAGTSAGYRDTPDRLIKIATHLRGLVGMLALPDAAALGWLGLLFATGVVALRRIADAARTLLLGAPLAVAACYLAWWLAITPTEFMWLRRILIALVLLQLLALPIAWQLRAHPQRGWRIAAGVLALLSLWLGWQHQLLWQRPDARATTQEDDAFFAALRALPADALTFGSGWWQAPVAALYSGRPMHDEERWDETRRASAARPTFLVLDRYAVQLGDHLRERLRWRCDCVPEFVGAGGRIYRMQRLFDTPEAGGTRVLRLEAATPQAGAGFAADAVGGVRWVEREAQLELPATNVGALVLDYVVPELHRFELDPGASTLQLRVSRGDCVVGDVALRAGGQSVLLADRCGDAGRTLRFTVNGRLAAHEIAPDTRALAWMFRGLEVYPASP